MKMVSFYYHSVVHTEPKQGYFLFMKARHEELCQNRCRRLLCKLPTCSCEGTGVQPVLFQPQAFGEEAGNQVLAGLALSWLFLSCVFMACLSGEWKAFLCMLLLQAGPVRLQRGHSWCACLLLLFIHSFTYLGGSEMPVSPLGVLLASRKSHNHLCVHLHRPRWAPGPGGELTHVWPFWKEGYFKGLEAHVRLELVSSLGRLGLQQVFDSGLAFLSSSLPACQPSTKAQDNEERRDILTSFQVPSRGPPGQHRG